MPTTDPEDTLQDEWRVRDLNNRESGPYTREELERSAKEGRIDLQWAARAGFGQVTTVREVIEMSDSGARWLRGKGLREKLDEIKAELETQAARTEYTRGITADRIELRLRDVLISTSFQVDGQRTTVSQLAEGALVGHTAAYGVAVIINLGRKTLYVNWARAQSAGPLYGGPFGHGHGSPRYLNTIARNIPGYLRSSQPRIVGGVNARWASFNYEEMTADDEKPNDELSSGTVWEDNDRIADLQRQYWQWEIELEELDRQETTEATGPHLQFSSAQQLSVEDLLCLYSRQFEQLVADVWQGLGYETEVVGGPGDKGIDVIARKGSPPNVETIAIQCKRHNKPVPRDVAHNIVGAVAPNAEYSKVALVCTADFTKACREYSNQIGRLELYNGQWVCDQLKKLGIQTPQ